MIYICATCHLSALYTSELFAQELESEKFSQTYLKEENVLEDPYPASYLNGNFICGFIGNTV